MRRALGLIALLPIGMVGCTLLSQLLGLLLPLLAWAVVLALPFYLLALGWRYRQLNRRAMAGGKVYCMDAGTVWGDHTVVGQRYWGEQ